MSGTITVDPAAFSSAEIVDLRRFCGYAPILQAGKTDALNEIISVLTPDMISVLRTVFLANLRLLESDLPAMRAQLNVAVAAVFTRNPAEQAERNRLYRDQRRSLCLFLGIPTGPFLGIQVPGAFVV